MLALDLFPLALFLCKRPNSSGSIGVNPGGLGGRDPQISGRGVVGGSQWGSQGGSWESLTGGKILLYLIMYRKYIRKWRLLKRNRIIYPEIGVNRQFLPAKNRHFLKIA